jgi:hypothetical protein
MPLPQSCVQLATSIHPVSVLMWSAGSPLAEDVDSLVLSARAAVSKAHATIADLASPPKLAPSTVQSGPQGAQAAADLRQGSAGVCGLAGQPCEPPPPPQQQQQGHAEPSLQQHPQPPQPQPPPQQQQLGGALVGTIPLALAVAPLPPADAPDLEGRIAQLRQRSELVIRSECDKLIAAMHSMYDDFLLSVQQHGLLVRVSVVGPTSPGSGPAVAAGTVVPRASWPEPIPQAPNCPAPAGAVVETGAGADRVAACGGALDGRGCSSSACEQEQGLDGGSSENVAPNALGSAEAPQLGTFEFPQQGASTPAEQENSWKPQLMPGCGSAALSGLAGGLGFGSPIRLVPGSQRPSPAKPRSLSGMAERPLQGASSLGAGSALRLGQTHAQQRFSGLAAPTPTGTATIASAAPVASRLLTQVRPGALPASTTQLHSSPSPSYLSARSSLGHNSPSPMGLQQQATSRPRQLGGGGIGSSTGIGTSSSAAGTTQRRDLDSIVNSIRRLAAETR